MNVARANFCAGDVHQSIISRSLAVVYYKFY